MRRDRLPINELNQLFNCDPLTGKLFWKIAPGIRVHIGDEAGRFSDGIYIVMINQREYRVDEIIFAMTYGRYPVGELQHINFDRSDSSIVNLLDLGNSRSKRLKNIGNDGFIGVQVRTRKGKTYYYACLRVDGALLKSNAKPTRREAAQEYDRLVREYLGEGHATNESLGLLK